ncbi:hypothetical protein EWM64_g1715 [Hericium alpestre]|uniref:Uncharacterized protein n=1 Tax=Hericium alpestre TaxID=135208 RepID=A0A4Z0A7L3_9AGAM|nr:hypothetical protein EWM64_g1715 [Hericium alpestre]
MDPIISNRHALPSTIHRQKMQNKSPWNMDLQIAIPAAQRSNMFPPSHGKRKQGEVESLVRLSNIEQEDTMDKEEGDDDRSILQKSVVPIQVEAGPSARVYGVDRQVAQSANDLDKDTFKGQKVDTFPALIDCAYMSKAG